MNLLRVGGVGLPAGLIALLVLGCSRPAPVEDDDRPLGPEWFRDVTAEVGLDFVHDAGPTDDYFMPQIVGCGAAVFDFNNDGRMDLFLLQCGGAKPGSTCRLFQQMPDGTFKDVTAGSGLDVSGWNIGVAIGDVNNDGWPDVLLTQYLGVKLFLNNGNGTFTDVTEEAGLENPGWGTSACFFDYDRDGHLDLILTNYVDYEPARKCNSNNGLRDYCAPKSFKGTVSKMFHNLGPQAWQPGEKPALGPEGKPRARVRFEDVTVAAGLTQAPGPGLGVICYDFDGDGWPDFLIANDGKPNHLWINQKDGTFKEEAVARGIAVNAMGLPEANMGIGLADVDGDGLMDVFVTHLSLETNTLWKQGPRGLFQDCTVFSGLSRPLWRATGFGTVVGDFDQDGAPDVALVNGRVARGPAVNEAELGTFWAQYGERNQIFANDGTGKFTDISPQNKAFCGTPRVGRGLAAGDITGSGSLDLVSCDVNTPVRLYKNVAPNRGHWLIVRALDPALKRDAYGAEVVVKAGGRSWVRAITPSAGYLCSNDPRAHFGLGKAERVDAIDVLWPDGKREVFPGGDVDRRLTLRRGEGRSPG
jgi:hypothetical protein